MTPNIEHTFIGPLTLKATDVIEINESGIWRIYICVRLNGLKC